MGVTGLWNLIEPCGKVVPVDTLENKILAIDISIWLHQVVKGFQDNKGGTLPNAHLLGLFHRLCKLLYYRIKPVFVFDGKVPQLKRETIAKRSQSRNKMLNEADRIQNLILQSLAKEKIVQQALGPNAVQILSSPTKPVAKVAPPNEDDLFKLPELPDTEKDELSTTGDYTTVSETDSSFDEGSASNYYNCNLQAIDVNSPYFKNLPADVRHEVLVDIKETRKQSSWGRLHELPAKSDDFCSFQMKRLLKRRQVQVSLEEAEKEMGGRSLTLAELQTFFAEEGIVEPSTVTGSKHIASDENTRYLLVKDLKKTFETKESEEPQPSTSTQSSRLPSPISVNPITKEELGPEYDDHLALAIQMSLDDTNVYDEKDYDCDTAKLNQAQRKNFKNSAKTLARDYLIEYGGMNDEDIEDLLEETQRKDKEDEIEASFHFKHTDPSILNADNVASTLNDDSKEEKNCSLNTTTVKESEGDVGYMSSDGSDSEIIEDPISPDKNNVSSKTLIDSKKIEIVVDVSTKLPVDDDLFADVFVCENESKKSVMDQTKISEINESKKPITHKMVSDEKFRDAFEHLTNTAKTDIKLIGSDVKIPKTLIPKPVSRTEICNILEDLKKEAANVSNLSLESIKLHSVPIIEISDSDGDLSQKVSAEPLIETEQENNEKVNYKSSPTEEIIIINDDDQTNDSTIMKTPKKGKIDDFFESKYVIKRTPDKPKDDEENIAKVKSPFFVKKSPKTPKSSGKKRHHADDTPSKTISVSKTLFEKPTNEKDDDIVPIIVDPIEEAAAALKEKKSHEELIDLAGELAKEKKDLEMERNRQDRMGTSITEKMNADCMQLLRLFGIPYIVAPMEAEAQCAFLDAMNLTDGTITDDSDIWLFGGRTVYKNFFNQQKHVLEFKSETIEKSFRVDRKKLIQLAILVGSDYTTGIHGIGAVTALEILAMFPSTEPVNGETTEMMSALSSLRKFRDWYKNSKVFGSSQKMSLRKKLKNIELNEGFPNMAIVEAYLSPTVDKNREKFTWGTLDIETIREYAKKYLGWTRNKTDDILLPVLKRINERKHQANIKNYFSVKSALATKEVSVSKRVKKAIERMAEDYKSDEESPKPAKVRKQRKAKDDGKAVEKNPISTRRRKATGEINPEEKPSKPKLGKQKPKEGDLEALPSSSGICSNSTYNLPKMLPDKNRIIKKIINRPNPNTIPQRERDLAENEKRKAIAAAILRKTRSS